MSCCSLFEFIIYVKANKSILHNPRTFNHTRSHHIMKNLELNIKVPIPVHGSKDIQIGFIKAIEKQTGVKLL